MPKSSLTIETLLPAERPDVAILRLKGSLDEISVDYTENTLKQLPPERRLLIVNCGKLRFMSNSGMGLFVETLGRLEGQGGRIVFAEVAEPEVQDGMSVMGFYDVFEFFSSEQEALKTIKSCKGEYM